MNLGITASRLRVTENREEVGKIENEIIPEKGCEKLRGTFRILSNGETQYEESFN